MLVVSFKSSSCLTQKGKALEITTGYETGQTPKLVWTLVVEEKIPPVAGVEPMLLKKTFTD
jgi:hypothetical protein